jgi:uncharacterized protein YbjQ (UPF0145 family)
MSWIKTCGKCGHQRDINDGLPKWRCPKCEVVYPETKESALHAFNAREAEKSKPVLLTTETYAPDLVIKERLGIVSAECVFGMNILKDAFAAVTDITGGRSKTTQTGLRSAKRTCLDELATEAKALGADAVIAIDLDYSEFSGGGMFGEKSMLFLVASGTAVKLEKKSSANPDGEVKRNPFLND